MRCEFLAQGDKEAVDALLNHPDVKAISFVDSTPIAQYICTTGTSNGKRVPAFGGARNFDAGETEGAKVFVSGRNYRQDKQGLANGYCMGGTLLDNVTPDMSVWKDEILGPVLSVVRRNSYQKALDLVHSHVYADAKKAGRGGQGWTAIHHLLLENQNLQI